MSGRFSNNYLFLSNLINKEFFYPYSRILTIRQNIFCVKRDDCSNKIMIIFRRCNTECINAHCTVSYIKSVTLRFVLSF